MFRECVSRYLSLSRGCPNDGEEGRKKESNCREQKSFCSIGSCESVSQYHTDTDIQEVCQYLVNSGQSVRSKKQSSLTTDPGKTGQDLTLVSQN